MFGAAVPLAARQVVGGFGDEANADGIGIELHDKSEARGSVYGVKDEIGDGNAVAVMEGGIHVEDVFQHIDHAVPGRVGAGCAVGGLLEFLELVDPAGEQCLRVGDG